MATSDYRELDVWRAAVELAVHVVRMTQAMPREELFGYVAQMRRAAGSIPANIAEGNGRGTRREYLRFAMIANGSLKELETHLTIARALGWCAPADLDRADALCGRIGRMLVRLRRALARPIPDSRGPIPGR